MKISRRKFFNTIIGLLGIPFVYSINEVVNKNKLNNRIKVSLPDDLPIGLSNYKNLIILKKNSSIKVMSSRCTHLGCEIRVSSQNKLICPCHGSEYDSEGNVLKGPANKSLKKLEIKLDSFTGEKFVHV